MENSDSHTMIVKSIEALGAKMDTGFKEVNESITELKVANATVSTQVGGMKDSSTTIRREVAIIREAQLTCPGRTGIMGANSRLKTLEIKMDDVREDSSVVEMPYNRPSPSLGKDGPLIIPKWFWKTIAALIGSGVLTSAFYVLNRMAGQ